MPPVPAKLRDYHSRALRRRQPYACYIPEDAERTGQLYPLLILLHGADGAWQDWGKYTRIGRYLAGTDLIVVSPEGGNGWYTDAADGGERREADIVGDLMPALEADLPLLPAPARAISGLSMGGYGAVKLALKYPRLFPLGVSHSGALDIAARPGWHPVFGDADTQSAFRRQENPAWLAEQALSRPASERPKLIHDCGLSDPLIEINRAFSNHLNFIGYGHTYREMPGYHTWPYWDRAFRTALPEIIEALGPAQDRRADGNG